MDQKALADRVVAWQSGQKNRENYAQEVEDGNNSVKQGEQSRFNNLKCTTVYDYFKDEVIKEMRGACSDMNESELANVVISRVIAFKQVLASVNSGKYLQGLMEGEAVDLPERTAPTEKENRPKLDELKKKTIYELLREKINDEREARGQSNELTEKQWDVLIFTKKNAIRKFEEKERDASKFYRTRAKRQSDVNGMSDQEKKEVVLGYIEEVNKLEQKELSGRVQPREPFRWESMSLLECTKHLQVVQKIEDVLIRAIERSTSDTDKLFSGDQVFAYTKFLNINELQELYVCMCEWKALPPSGMEIPDREKLEKLLGQDSVELYSLRKLFPVKESGSFKDLEDDGFVIVDAHQREPGEIIGRQRRKKAVADRYEGARSLELQRYMERVDQLTRKLQGTPPDSSLLGRSGDDSH